MPQWKKNLAVLWFGQLLVMGGMTLILPFLSLFLQEELGIHNTHAAATWAGVIFAGNFVTSFLFQPLWGKLSDRYGSKIMLLRSGFGMAIVMVLMGFVQNPWQLLALRLLNGTISGFNPAATSIVAKMTPQERIGFAMGTLQSGGIAGTLLGPLIGGILADHIGFRAIFYVTGVCLFLASLLTTFIVKEAPATAPKNGQPTMSVYAGIRSLIQIPQIMVLVTATFLIQFAMLGPMPVMPLYVKQLLGEHHPNIALWAGMVGSAAGLSNMFASPLLGKLSDRIGQRRVLLMSMAGAALMFIPQALATTVPMLLVSRFLQGIFLGGLIPSVNALLRKHSPQGMEARVISLNSSTLSLGNMVGPIIGGVLSSYTGLAGVFVVSAFMLVINIIWVLRSLSTEQPQSLNHQNQVTSSPTNDHRE